VRLKLLPEPVLDAEDERKLETEDLTVEILIKCVGLFAAFYFFLELSYCSSE